MEVLVKKFKASCGSNLKCTEVSMQCFKTLSWSKGSRNFQRPKSAACGVFPTLKSKIIHSLVFWIGNSKVLKMKKCQFLNDFEMWLVTFAKTASLFFLAVFAAFEKKAYGQNGFAFWNGGGEQNECLFKITYTRLQFCASNWNFFREWAASFQSLCRRHRLTIWIRCVQASDESPDTSKFIELLDTLCPAKFHQIAELLERNTITRGRRHGKGSLAQKIKVEAGLVTEEVDLKVASN